jgi:hypothetical protein
MREASTAGKLSRTALGDLKPTRTYFSTALSTSWSIPLFSTRRDDDGTFRQTVQ